MRSAGLGVSGGLHAAATSPGSMVGRTVVALVVLGPGVSETPFFVCSGDSACFGGADGARSWDANKPCHQGCLRCVCCVCEWFRLCVRGRVWVIVMLLCEQVLGCLHTLHRANTDAETSGRQGVPTPQDGRRHRAHRGTGFPFVDPASTLFPGPHSWPRFRPQKRSPKG